MRGAVYVVRHGESEWNVRRLTQGQVAHPPLTDLGRDQAVAAAALVGSLVAGPASVVSSDLVRATQTAEVVAAALGASVTLDDRLREQHLGDLEGRGYEETWAAAAEHDWSDPTLPVAGGESPWDVRRRVAAAHDDALADALAAGGTVVLVSHGDTIRALLGHLSGVPPQEAPWTEVPNGAVFRTDRGRGERLHPPAG